MTEPQGPTTRGTTGEAEPRIAIHDGRGVQVGNGNIQINAYGTPVPTVERLHLSPAVAGDSPHSRSCPLTRAPRSPLEEEILLQTSPGGWEYLYYAACLLRRRQALSAKWRSHEIGYAPPTGEWLDKTRAIGFLNLGFPEMLSIIQNITTSLDPRVQEAAFGKLGEPGQAASIDEMASYLIDSAEHMLNWSARMRGTAVPDQVRRVFSLAAELTSQPLREIDQFICSLVATFDQIPSRWAIKYTEPLYVTLTLELTVDKNLLKEYRRELKRASR